jgi:hypothetical protein
MAVIVVVPAAAVGAMFMMMVVIMAVMVMFMGMRSLFGMHAALRLKFRFGMRNMSAECGHEFLDPAIARNAKAIRKHLCRDVTVAEIPGDTRKLPGIAGGYLRNRLVRRDHAYDPPVFQLQAVTVPQHSGLGRIEQENRVVRCTHRDTSAVAPVMRQLDRVGFARAIPMAGWKNFGGADHGPALKRCERGL